MAGECPGDYGGGCLGRYALLDDAGIGDVDGVTFGGTGEIAVDQLGFEPFACDDFGFPFLENRVDFIGEECVVFFASLLLGFAELPLSGDEGLEIHVPE